MPASDRPTSVRYAVVGLTTCVAVLLYIDRFCLGFVAPYVRENLGLSPGQMAFTFDMFFYVYAFSQIPGGWLADRYGARLMVAVYLAAWSALTGLMGLAQGLTSLLVLRALCGLFQAGAYPASAGLIRRWVPYERRGLASGVVSIGGRAGGAIVPILTAYLMVSFVPASVPSQLEERDLLDVRRLAVIVADTPSAPQEPTLGKMLAPRLRAALPAELTDYLTGAAAHIEMQVDRAVADREAKGKPVPKRELLVDEAAVSMPPNFPADFIAALNNLLARSDLVTHNELQPFRHKLPSEALRVGEQGSFFTPEELARRNRLVLEAAFPEAIRKIYGEGWRPALLLYGGAGILLAAIFFWLVRDTPRQHPYANEAEAHLAESGEPATTAAPVAVPASVLWAGILTSPSLWLSALVQFGTNFGWIFLGNLFPTYLRDVHQVPELERGWMASLPSMLSIPVMLAGGWWTDRLTRRLGPRWGRCLPLASTRFAAGLAFLACIVLNAPWPITFALITFSVLSDLGIPAVWAFNLDVGGKNVGLVLGWGNMWGNLGAAVSTSTLVWMQSSLPGKAGWDAVFLTCGVVFLLIGVASLGIDATKPIIRAPGTTGDAGSAS